MIEIKLGDNKVQMYDGVEDMPIVKFNAFNKYLLIDSGIGGDLFEIDVHITKIAKLMRSDTDLALQELMNMRQAMYYVTQGVNPKHMSFVCLIHKFNGELVNDLSSENINIILKKLKATKKGLIDSMITSLKKKIDDELSIYFPSFFSDTHKKIVYDMLKQRTSLVLDGIINENNNAEKISKADDELLSMSKPKKFDGKEGIEVKYNKQFENMCFLITQSTNTNTKKMTVFEYYTAVELLKKQTPKNKTR